MSTIETLASLPVFFRLRDRRVLVAGRGAGVRWKVELLAATGARVRWRPGAPAPDFAAALSGLVGVEMLPGSWSEADFEAAVLAVLDADDDVEAAAFAAAARRAGTPVNVVDRPEFCDFSFGAIVNRSPLVVAISTEGAAPVFGQALRTRIEALLPLAMKAWAQAARDWRERVKPLGWDFRRRRRFWERFAGLALAAGERGPSDRDYAELAGAEQGNAAPAPGRIWLVGAGPGDPDLLTLRAVRVLQSADVILYDGLVSPGALELARREALRIDVGKRAGALSPGQAEISARMVALALEGKAVVRLKGGDPTVFGRANEEIAAARTAGVEIEIVPGVTTALAAAAELVVSLTDREHAPRLQFATLSDREGEFPPTLDWRALADPAATTAIYMGGRRLAEIIARLLVEGADPRTPAVYAENVGRPEARRIVAALGELPAAVVAGAAGGPALILYGSALGVRGQA